MKRHLYSSVIVGFLMVMSIGCASRSCGERMTFREWFSNRPRPVMDLFNRGDECSTCAVHDGHVESFDMQGGCANGNCMAPQGNIGSIGSGVESFPADTATLAPNNRIRTNYPPAFAPGELALEKATGLTPISNAELENPPGYGR